MIKLKSLIEIAPGYEFVGFHKQKRQRPSPYDDMFYAGNNYGKSYFREILDSLFTKDRDEAMKNGWLDYEWDEYDENYDKMEKEVASWLNEKGYRWIFVTENRPIGVSGYGENTYKIYFKKNDILHIFDDPMGADDVAYAYVYHISHPPIEEEYYD